MPMTWRGTSASPWREVLACGWLARQFVTRQKSNANAGGNAPVCAAETARWLFAVASDPASSREAGLPLLHGPIPSTITI